MDTEFCIFIVLFRFGKRCVVMLSFMHTHRLCHFLFSVYTSSSVNWELVLIYCILVPALIQAGDDILEILYGFAARIVPFHEYNG